MKKKWHITEDRPNFYLCEYIFSLTMTLSQPHKVLFLMVLGVLLQE